MYATALAIRRLRRNLTYRATRIEMSNSRSVQIIIISTLTFRLFGSYPKERRRENTPTCAQSTQGVFWRCVLVSLFSLEVRSVPTEIWIREQAVKEFCFTQGATRIWNKSWEVKASILIYIEEQIWELAKLQIVRNIEWTGGGQI